MEGVRAQEVAQQNEENKNAIAREPMWCNIRASADDLALSGFFLPAGIGVPPRQIE